MVSGRREYIHFLNTREKFGFLCLNTQECPGNMGLKDIELALRWVQNNIKFFGGNPNNVTLLGSSSGSIKIHQLMMIRSCKGLFHKAILMGMYSINPFVHYPPNPIDQAFELARAMNFTGKSLQELYHFLKCAPTPLFINPLKDLNLNLNEKVRKVAISSPFLPVFGSIDGYLPKMPENMTKLENPVPIIFGLCDNEVPTLFIQKYRQFFEEDFYLVFRQNCYSWLFPLNKEEMKEIEEEVHKKYGEDDISMPSTAFSDLVAMEFYHTVVEVMHNIAPEIPIYVYKFQHEGSFNPFTNLVRSRSEEKIKGSFHSDDFFYWMYKKNPTNETEKYLVNLITKLFCNFARTGDPNEKTENTDWRMTTTENPCFVSITGENGLTQHNKRLNEDGILFWEGLKKKFAEEICKNWETN